mmetsp:Transcript_15002/g.56534  ORF Transcript_15002/g.56534 Transcript_15002/m.56534 type:complete len:280 (-) Transcript_15002:488-1327(-)
MVVSNTETVRGTPKWTWSRMYSVASLNSSYMPMTHSVSRASIMVKAMPPQLFWEVPERGRSSSAPHALLRYSPHTNCIPALICSARPLPTSSERSSSSLEISSLKEPSARASASSTVPLTRLGSSFTSRVTHWLPPASKRSGSTATRSARGGGGGMFSGRPGAGSGPGSLEPSGAACAAARFESLAGPASTSNSTADWSSRPPAAPLEPAPKSKKAAVTLLCASACFTTARKRAAGPAATTCCSCTSVAGMERARTSAMRPLKPNCESVVAPITPAPPA